MTTTNLPEAAKPAAGRWLGLTVILAATLMDLLDSTVVNVAAPTIHRDLGGSTASLQWIAAAYTLALAAGLLVGGRLGDMFGRRPMLLGSAAAFTVASLACSAAWSPQSLIAARALQGLLAAMMVPQSFGLIRDLFPGREMGKAFAVFGPAIGLSTILGPVVAGLLINADLFGSGWRAVFLINLPLGAFTLIAGRKALPAGKRSAQVAAGGKRLDLVGALLAAAAMCMLVFPLIQGRELGWPSWCFGLLAGCLPVFALFALRQRALARSGGGALVDLGIFAKRSYTSGLVFIVSFFGVVVGFSLAVGLFLQLGLGYSAMHASLTMTASAGGAFVGSALGATVGANLGRRVLHLGLALMGVGIIAFYLVLSHFSGAVAGWDLAGPLAVYGLGMGAIFVPLFDVVLGDLGDHEVGSASGVLEAVQQLGACLGVAVLGTVFFNSFGAHVEAAAGSAAGPAVHAAELVALLALALTAVAFALVFLLPRKARQDHAPADSTDSTTPGDLANQADASDTTDGGATADEPQLAGELTLV